MRSFTSERASSPAQAAATAARLAGAKFVAGGTNLLDLMKMQIERPSHLIDVNGLALDKIEPTPEGGLRIGVLVRNTDMAGASAQLRNAETATTAGNLLQRPQESASATPVFLNRRVQAANGVRHPLLRPSMPPA